MEDMQNPNNISMTDHQEPPVILVQRRPLWLIIVACCLIGLLIAGGVYWYTRPRIDPATLSGRFVCALAVGDATAASKDRYAIFGMPANGKALERLLPNGRNVQCIPNKKAVMFAAGDGSSRTTPRGYTLPAAQHWYMMSPTGRHVEEYGPEVDPYYWPEPFEYAQIGPPAPDLFCQRVAIAVAHHGTTDILVQTMGSRIIPLTKNKGIAPQKEGGTDGHPFGYNAQNIIECGQPLFSPDNSTVLFLRRDSRKEPCICITGVEVPKIRVIAEGSFPSFHPSGKLIAYVTGAPYTDSIIYRVGIDGTSRKLLAKNAGWPAFSPDGQYLAYVETKTETPWLCVMKVDGTAKTRLLSLPHPVDSLAWVTG